MNNHFYAGIGSRTTPAPVLALMTGLAASLEQSGYTLRSGGADGADKAFESGVDSPDAKAIFLPWRGFNENKSQWYLEFHSKEILRIIEKIARDHHPAWQNCSAGARKLMMRNVQQILGWRPTSSQPSDFVLCWTKDGKDSGGTGTAIRIARTYEIPVYNLYNEEDRIRLWGKIDWEGSPTNFRGLAL